MKGKYIYGVIKVDKPQKFGMIGVGNPPSEVQTVCLKNLAAVVSNSPLKIYTSEALEETVKELVAHQFVIEKVMKDFTILPVKFGTMVETKNEVIKFLDKGYFLLRNQLRQMEDKIELDVVASWKLPEAAASLYLRSRLIKRKQLEFALKGDKASLEDKIVLGKLVNKALNSKKVRFSRLILQALKKEAIDVCLHDLAGGEMVFNAAFLIERENEEFFNKALNLLDQKLENTLNFRLVGPLPPYSFSTVLLERINPCEVEEAKETLGLNGEITDKAVRDAYRKLSFKFHPDKNAGVDPTHFNLINSAYKVLKNFLEKGYFHVDIYRFEGRL